MTCKGSLRFASKEIDLRLSPPLTDPSVCSAVITTRLIAAQFNGKGISPIPEVEVAPLKILSTGFALPRGTKRKLAIASRDIFPDQDVQAMISDVIHVSVERGHNSTVRPSKVREYSAGVTLSKISFRISWSRRS